MTGPVTETNADLLIPADGRQSPEALEIQRGVVRTLERHGIACVTELGLASGRRADIVGLTARGDIWIVEIKSSVNDFRTDQKWPEYREYCDALFFAVMPSFPQHMLPLEVGLILADRYGGEILRHPLEMRMAPARRKAMTLRFARTAAVRLSCAADPSLRQWNRPVADS